MAYQQQQYPAPPPPYSQNPGPVGFGGPPPPSAPNQTVFIQPPGASVHVAQPAAATTTTAYVVPVGAVGTCPACRVGMLTNEFTCCGIFLGICLFPIGMICCFMMQERRCTNCRASFG